MELSRIETLLVKYFEADTSTAEEQELQHYFSQENVAPHLEEYRSMFAFFSRAKEEQYTKPLPSKPSTKFNTLIRWISVAAVAVFVFGIYFGNPFSTSSQLSDEELLAYQQTKDALEFVSLKLNKGAQSIEYLGEFETAKNKILINN